MPSKESRKEASRQFKERKPFPGIFAIRCGTTGHVWVGASRNLYSIENSSWFQLRHQGHPNKDLQQEWNVAGEPSFVLEVLEKLDEDIPAIIVGDVLQQKKNQWTARLKARPLL